MSDKAAKKKPFKIVLIAAAVIAVVIIILLISNKTKNVAVHLFYHTYSDVYPSTVRAAADKYLDEFGISHQNYDGSGNQTTQSEQILSTLSRNPRVIVINQVDSTSDNASELLTKAASLHDTYVIFFNREVTDETINSYDKAIFIGSKVEEAGIIQGKMIGEYLLKHYNEADLNHDGKISYILFKGQEGNAEANARTKYSVETANEILTSAGYPELEFYDPNNPNKYILDQNGSWSASATNEYMASALIKYCDANDNMIELVIANNDNMAEGAISALNKAGYNTGKSDKRIPVYGVDATESAKVLIHNGCMTGTVLQDADKTGLTIAQVCDNVLSGRDMLDGLDDIPIDDNCRKLRIHYAEYTEN